MRDQDKTREQLISELENLRGQVAERERAEEALRESEERYRLLSEAIPHPVWRSDAEGRQIDCNRRWQEYTGQTPEEAQGDGWMKALHPDDVAWAVQRKREDVAGGELYQAEYRLRRASDNSYHWYLARAIPRRDANGTILGWFGCAMDIEAQKQAQEALAEREAQLLEAQEVASLGFYFWDIAADRWTSSSVLDQILDIPADYEKTVDGWASLVHPDERQETLDHLLKEVVGEKKPCDREYRIVRYGDKQVRWVHGLGRLQFNADGQPVSMLGTIQDITERKRAEEALQKAHDELEQRVKERTAELAKANQRLAYLASFPEQNPHPIIEVGLGGDIRYVNAAAQRLFPELHEQGLKHPWLGNWEAVLRQFGEVRAETAIHEVALADRCYQQVFSCLAQDQVVRIYGLDITDRKRAEEALRQSEERLRLAQHVARVGTFELNLQTGLNIWTPELEAMYGLSPGGFPQTESAWENLVYGGDRAAVIQLRAQTLQTGKPVEGEWRVVWPDGSVHWLAGRWQAFKDESGKPLRMIGVNIDITERKQAEEALHRERRTLKYLLEASDHERRLISYDIHDGLAQALAGAIMQFQIYAHAQQVNPKDAAKAFDSGMMMLQQSHMEARRLISGVRPPILDESGVVAAIVHLVYDPAFDEGPKIDFRNRVTFKHLPPVVDNVIYRIVQEGLTNARNHSKSEKILVSLRQRGDRLRIEIRDWGVGFDPQTVQENRFGLKGIRERARLLGGRCSIKSKPGEGTSIVVELPVAERESER